MEPKVINFMEKLTPLVQAELEKNGVIDTEEEKQILGESLGYFGAIMEDSKRTIAAQANFYEKMGVVADKLSLFLDGCIANQAPKATPKRSRVKK